jgi:hypothetical protein
LGTAPHIAPYAVSTAHCTIRSKHQVSIFLMHHCVAPNGCWYVCTSCKASSTTQALRARFLPQYSVLYSAALLSSCPMKSMLLSIADVGVAMTLRPTGFAHGSTMPSVFDGALVAWGFTPTVLDVPGKLLELLALNHGDKPFVPCFRVHAGARESLVFNTHSTTDCSGSHCGTPSCARIGERNAARDAAIRVVHFRHTGPPLLATGQR